MGAKGIGWAWMEHCMGLCNNPAKSVLLSGCLCVGTQRRRPGESPPVFRLQANWSGVVIQIVVALSQVGWPELDAECGVRCGGDFVLTNVRVVPSFVKFRS
ncbi:unnamed protein product [Ostreobium quekettii]|uniref:Uncharacterized protein n=1 Tax=Ostreobium quekettii TaxID=121088 RepID=A0A8S1IKB9_9CHLO|nr:unnamed protein product [Ostreobium quekettii]